jgi:hypothetical protein
VALETAVADDIRHNLAQRGHELWAKGKPLHYGGGQVIVRDPASGVLIGGSEPSKRWNGRWLVGVHFHNRACKPAISHYNSHSVRRGRIEA